MLYVSPSLGINTIFVGDQNIDYAQQAAQAQVLRLAARAANDEPPAPPGGDDGGGGGGAVYPPSYGGYTYDTNGLWLELTNVAAGLAYLNLHHATNQVYALWSTTNLPAGWQVETEVWPTNQDVMPFAVPTLDRQSLFLRAEDWTDVDSDGDGIPDWWIWLYFGNLAQTATNLDSAGNTLLYDYQNGLAPATFQFTALATPNNYFNTSQVPVQLAVSGAPYWIAILVDDPNFADANWTAYTSASVTVNLGLTEGWHQVWVGLRGRADAANAVVWQSKRLKLDLTPPQLVITSPTNNLVTQPVIQLLGYSPEALSSISYDLTNALGLVTNQPVLVLDQSYSTNTWEFTTNTFQAFDLPLTNGLNLITLHATDLAGNTTTTNLSFTLDYSSKTNPPLVNLYWPQDGTLVCNSNYTWRGWISDPTATVTAQLVDASGATNLFNGLVERDGKFWVENLPLSDGTNELTLTVADVVGNVATTNITVFPGTIALAITVWLPAGGTAVIQAQAIPNSANAAGSGGGPVTYDNLGNPTLSPANAAEIQTDKPSRLFVQSYTACEDLQYNSQYTDLATDDTFLESGTVQFNQCVDVNWTDGQGGSGSQNMQDTWIINDPPVSGTNSTAWVSQQTWPASWWPDLANGTQTASGDYDWPLFDPNCGPAPVIEEHCAVNIPCANSWYDPYIFDIAAYENGSYRGTYTRWAQTVMKLQTGGKGLSQRENLWQLNASATQYFLRDAGVSLPAITGSGQSVDLTDVRILGSPLDSDGHLWKVLPDNAEADVTPTLSGADDFGFGVSAMEYPLRLQANWQDCQSEYVISPPVFIVGQFVPFSSYWAGSAGYDRPPPGLQRTTNLWTLAGHYYNDRTNSVAGVSWPTCSINYFVNQNMLTNDPTTAPAWWVSGGTDCPDSYPVTLDKGLFFSNGQYVSLHEEGTINMRKPNAEILAQTTSVNVIDEQLIFQQSTNAGITFAFDFPYNQGFPGRISWLQVNSQCIRTIQDGSGTNHNLVQPGPGPWLDGGDSYPYQAATTGYAYDSPMLEGRPTDVRVDASDAFQMWLMFTPTGGQRVPLRAVDWSWWGFATNGPSGWALGSGTNSVNPTDYPTETYPSWKSQLVKDPYISYPRYENAGI